MLAVNDLSSNWPRYAVSTNLKNKLLVVRHS